jgi:hypothetical protein
MPGILTAPKPGDVAPPAALSAALSDAPTIAPAGALRVGPRPGRVASDRAGTVGRDLADAALPWAVGLVALVARLATGAAGPTDWDSSQYAAAIARFDVTHGRPQPPGYFLYVVAGRLVHATGIGTVDSLVLVSAMASALAAGLVVVAGRDLGGRWVGVAAGLLVATSPFAWFNGSIVATYSFDLVAAPLLIILAWRARPHSWHGAAALASLGLLAGFRQSVVQAFALLAVIALVGSVRRVREALVALVAGVAAMSAWFVPMALTQPGGASAWARATRIETVGAIRATSILDHVPAGRTNLGTVAAYTTVALAPLVALALVSACLLGIRGLVRLARRPRGALATTSDPSDARAHSPRTSRVTPPPAPPAAHRTGHVAPPTWTRPWYQSRTAILAAAVLPPLALVALVQFAKGGYLLAYLPGAVIALLLVPAALLRARPALHEAGARSSSRVGARVWAAVASLAVVAIAVLGTQRFLSGTGVLPGKTSQTAQGAWLTQARYQAPYLDTRFAIRSADAVDRALARVAPLVRPGRDVVVIDTIDGGSAFYRNAGWELPLDRVALVAPGIAVYNEQFGSLFYTSSRTIPVGVGGSVLLIASPSLPGLARLAGNVKAFRVAHAQPVAHYLVWRIAPGASVLGVQVVVLPGPRPPGSAIFG